ncbi:mitochondrial calcium uniporter regulator 1-like isoform X2 [Acanthaster planci]|uniref:Mitochondrial calcium uniporter regulator 1-like isoform X2 n=1 Tax=Acanthaster planci TaxID=133434 RepID=A0A8B7YS28_ACAPL|nr:mitochondrial calcium uniporter regulator 1-like isoform X2 [Acanthaster planci]
MANDGISAMHSIQYVPSIAGTPKSNCRFFCASASSASRPVDIVTKDKVFIDTNGLVNSLEENGFSRQQAECLTTVLVSVFSKNAEVVSKETISKEQLEISVQMIMSHISAVKKDMVILEKSEFSTLRTENERLANQVTQLNKQLKDDISNLSNKVLLDINMEKSRVKEQANEHRMLIETNKNLVTTEVANVMSKLEATKNDIFRYFAGTLLGCLTIALGFYRIWSH